MKWILVVATFFVSAAGLAADRPTIVLVHDTLFTAKSWRPLEKSLNERGLSALAVDLPGRNDDKVKPKDVDLRTASEKICKAITKIEGDVLLVGHGLGGALINQSLSVEGGPKNACQVKIKGLVYVAAVVPLDGEKGVKDIDPKRDVGFEKVTKLDKKNKLYVLNKNGPIREFFMQDVPEDEAKAVIKTMVSEPSKIGTMRADFCHLCFDSLPKYYIETTNDRVLTLKTQKKIQEKLPFQRYYSMDTGHCPFVSKPDELAGILEEIVNNLEKDSQDPRLKKSE